jgi:hypothetical protein
MTNKRQPSRKLDLSEKDRAMIRKAGAEAGRRSRVAQGLPQRVENPVAVALLAELLENRTLRSRPEDYDSHDDT